MSRSFYRNSTKKFSKREKLIEIINETKVIEKIYFYFIDFSREYFARKVDTNLYSAGMIGQVSKIAPKSSQSITSSLFVGPQEEKTLEAIYPGLELVKDYGWLTILAKPLYWLVDKLHNFIGNWGD